MLKEPIWSEDSGTGSKKCTTIFAPVITSKFPRHFFLPLFWTNLRPFLYLRGYVSQIFSRGHWLQLRKTLCSSSFPSNILGKYVRGSIIRLKIIGTQYFACKVYLVLWRCCLRVEHSREKFILQSLYRDGIVPPSTRIYEMYQMYWTLLSTIYIKSLKTRICAIIISKYFFAIYLHKR